MSLLHGNAVLPLDDPGAVWCVDSGALAVFAVDTSVSAEGRRRFFFTVEAGGQFPGVPGGDGLPAIIVVALEDTTLRRLDPASASFERELQTWVDSWTAALAQLDLELESCDARSEDALGAFHRRLLERIRDLVLRETTQDRARFAERERRSSQATHEAISELTTLLQPHRRVLPAGSDLFVAASRVAHAEGIELRPPPAWEDATENTDPIQMIARTSHIRIRGIILHDRWWTHDCGAVLGFTGKDRKPVALLPRGSKRYELFDPETQERTPVDDSIACRLAPQGYVFYRPLPENATSGFTLLKFALRGRSRDLALIAVAGVAATLLGMFTPLATALLIDKAIPDADTGLLGQIGLGLVAAAFGAALFRLSQGIVLMRVQTGADASTQAAVWDRVLNLQLSFFRKYSTGDLESRVTAISEIRELISGATLRTLFGSVILVLNLFLLLYYSPTLTLIALLAAAVSAAISIFSGIRVLRCVRQILELYGRFFGLLVQLVTGISKLRVAAAEERAFARWAHEYSKLLRLKVQQRRIHDTVQSTNIAVTTLSSIALFAVSAELIRSSPGALSTGVFLAFNTAFGTFIGSVVALSNTVTDMMEIAIQRERTRPIMEAVPEVNERKTDAGRLDGRIDLEHLVFQYDPDGPLILDDTTIRVGAGQFVAIVGPSGSGKSTLFRLLLGFESPQSGSIFYDGQDLTGLDVYSVRRQMGVVLQAGRINAGSLFDNIVSGTRLSLEDAWGAAAATGFAADIKAMPMGMHTVISEGGTNLSGGQRQRLLLTRALVHKPSILLLDEATSALDNHTQAIVSASLNRLSVTRIVIAHRLSTIREADRIYVIDGGRIDQAGTFDELASQTGLFSRLMARQMA